MTSSLFPVSLGPRLYPKTHTELSAVLLGFLFWTLAEPDCISLPSAITLALHTLLEAILAFFILLLASALAPLVSSQLRIQRKSIETSLLWALWCLPVSRQKVKVLTVLHATCPSLRHLTPLTIPPSTCLHLFLQHTCVLLIYLALPLHFPERASQVPMWPFPNGTFSSYLFLTMLIKITTHWLF